MKITKTNMKNINKSLFTHAIVLLFLILVITMSGCISEESKETEIVPQTEKTQPVETPTTEEKSIVETYCDLVCRLVSKSCYDDCCKEKNKIYEGIKKDGISHCDLIDNINDKDVCIYLFAISKKDISFCERISTTTGKDDPIGKNYCIMGVAVAKKDVYLCKRISTTTGTDDCIALVAGAKKDVYLCDRTSTLIGYENCIAWVAEARQDVSLCDKSPTILGKDICIGSVARARQDVSLCEEKLNGRQKDVCISWIAEAKGDVSLCDKISDTYVNRECIKKAS